MGSSRSVRFDCLEGAGERNLKSQECIVVHLIGTCLAYDTIKCKIYRVIGL